MQEERAPPHLCQCCTVIRQPEANLHRAITDFNTVRAHAVHRGTFIHIELLLLSIYRYLL